MLLGIDGAVFAANGYRPVVAAAHHHAFERGSSADMRGKKLAVLGDGLAVVWHVLAPG